MLSPPRSCLSSASRSLAQGSREAWHSHTCLLRAEGRTVVEARASQAPAPVPRASLGFLSRLLPRAPRGSCKLVAFTPQSPGFLITWTRLLSGGSPNGQATLFLPDSSPDISRRGCNASFLLWKSQSRAPIHLATDSQPPCPPFQLLWVQCHGATGPGVQVLNNCSYHLRPPNRSTPSSSPVPGGICPPQKEQTHKRPMIWTLQTGP